MVSSSLTIGFGEIGTILADWATVATEGKANIAIIVSNEVPPTIPLVANFKKQLAANCPQCKIVQEINVGVTEWGTKIQPAVQTAVQANPDINVVIPIYDSMSQFVVPALRLAGKTGQVKVATFNGTPFVLDYIQSGEVDMDIGESLDWIAYATVDGHLRDACGLKSPTALNVPFYIFDKSNAAEGRHARAVRHRLRRRLQVGLPQALGPQLGEHRGRIFLCNNRHSSRGRLGALPVLSVANLSKTFGGARALSGVSFDVMPGEVHGLLGKNGSGKSTLVKILAGFHAPDEGGTLHFNGEPVDLPLKPGDYRRLGMSFVHQNLGLVPSLTVLENLRLVQLTSGKARLHQLAPKSAGGARQALDALRPRSRSARTRRSPDARCSARCSPSFGPSKRSRPRAPSRGSPASILLDEPTPFLPASGVDQLFSLVRSITASGSSVIFISHDIDEVMEITDRDHRAARRRGGRRTARREATHEKIVEMIVGRSIERGAGATSAAAPRAPGLSSRFSNLAGKMLEPSRSACAARRDPRASPA